ncbi:hypothetical protein ABK040_004398 [Willaertia magna]
MSVYSNECFCPICATNNHNIKQHDEFPCSSYLTTNEEITFPKSISNYLKYKLINSQQLMSDVLDIKIDPFFTKEHYDKLIELYNKTIDKETFKSIVDYSIVELIQQINHNEINLSNYEPRKIIFYKNLFEKLASTENSNNVKKEQGTATITSNSTSTSIPNTNNTNGNHASSIINGGNQQHELLPSVSTLVNSAPSLLPQNNALFTPSTNFTFHQQTPYNNNVPLPVNETTIVKNNNTTPKPLATDKLFGSYYTLYVPSKSKTIEFRFYQPTSSRYSSILSHVQKSIPKDGHVNLIGKLIYIDLKKINIEENVLKEINSATQDPYYRRTIRKGEVAYWYNGNSLLFGTGNTLITPPKEDELLVKDDSTYHLLEDCYILGQILSPITNDIADKDYFEVYESDIKDEEKVISNNENTDIAVGTIVEEGSSTGKRKRKKDPKQKKRKVIKEGASITTEDYDKTAPWAALLPLDLILCDRFGKDPREKQFADLFIKDSIAKGQKYFGTDYFKRMARIAGHEKRWQTYRNYYTNHFAKGEEGKDEGSSSTNNDADTSLTLTFINNGSENPELKKTEKKRRKKAVDTSVASSSHPVDLNTSMTSNDTLNASGIFSGEENNFLLSPPSFPQQTASLSSLISSGNTSMTSTDSNNGPPLTLKTPERTKQSESLLHNSESSLVSNIKYPSPPQVTPIKVVPSQQSSSSTTTTPKKPSASSIIEKLKEIAILKEKNIITDSEVELLKKAILEELS